MPRLLALPLLALVAAGPALAAWPGDPLVNVPLTTAAGDQSFVQGRSDAAISDGAGGAFVVWHDLGLNSANEVGVFIQRVLADGTKPWGANGIAICTIDSFQVYPALISDGAGGAILTWFDGRNGNSTFDIYAQRVNGSGVIQWAANGVPVTTAAGSQGVPVLVSDGAGGAIIAWNDGRGANGDIYAQRINSAGVRQWSANDVALCLATGDQVEPRIVSDGAGGAIVSWYDYRAGTTNSDIYARRITAAGTPVWTANGVALCTAVNMQRDQEMVTDGAGGAIVTWYDERPGGGFTDIYAQRVASAGTVSWVANGVAVCSAISNQNSPAIATDGAGGAIVTWYDGRSGPNDVYAQRLDGAGVAQWTANGVAVCSATNNQWLPSIVADGNGGAILAWEDYRNNVNFSDIYAQRINAAGASQWTANGVAISTAAADQSLPLLVSDLAAGAVVAWQDLRNGNTDIYAQGVSSSGSIGPPPPDPTLPVINAVADVPNDQGGKVMVRWKPSSLDTAPSYPIASYTLWRRIYTPTVYWEFVVTVPANAAPGYAYMATTGSDSLPGSIPWNVFFVQAKTATGNTYYTSLVDSGYSVDNLSPTPPAAFTASYAAGVTRLHWSRNGESDLLGYRLYRGASPNFVPGPGNLIATPPDTGYTDPTLGAYYKLAAVDVHGNESASALVSPPQTTDVGPIPLATLSLAMASANPARGPMQLRYTLPRDGEARLTVHDVTGRIVRVLEMGARPAGNSTATWDARDRNGDVVGSGIYLVRLAAGGEAVTMRCTLLR